ncbi:MAG: hypothetical protein WD055_00465 [Candidatus Dependentiae bacterium]
MKKLFIIMLVFCASIIKADFTHVNLWQKKLATGEKQHVLCCGDRHRIMQKGLKQVERLMEFITKVPGKNEIIIEDALNYQISMQKLKENDDGSVEHKRLMEDFQDFQNEMNAYRRQDVIDGVISGIVLVPELAKEHDIACTNIEFRQVVTGQLPDLIELIDEHGFSHCKIINGIVETVLNTVESFDDSLQLNALCS